MITLDKDTSSLVAYIDIDIENVSYSYSVNDIVMGN